jgi:hypothetical protein
MNPSNIRMGEGKQVFNALVDLFGGTVSYWQEPLNMRREAISFSFEASKSLP